MIAKRVLLLAGGLGMGWPATAATATPSATLSGVSVASGTYQFIKKTSISPHYSDFIYNDGAGFHDGKPYTPWHEGEQFSVSLIATYHPSGSGRSETNTFHYAPNGAWQDYEISWWDSATDIGWGGEVYLGDGYGYPIGERKCVTGPQYGTPTSHKYTPLAAGDSYQMGAGSYVQHWTSSYLEGYYQQYLYREGIPIEDARNMMAGSTSTLTKCSGFSLDDTYQDTYETKASSSYSVKLSCTDSRPVKSLTVTGAYSWKAESGTATLLINGAAPQVVSSLYGTSQTQWEVPVSAKCGDMVELAFTSTTGIVYGRIRGISANFGSACDLKIGSLTGSSKTINPMSGDKVDMVGTITGASGKAVSWTLNMVDQTSRGAGNDVTATWDGKYADDSVVEPGIYSATLTAQTADGECRDSQTMKVSVTQAPNDECLYVEFGSRAHVASGNLSHSQDLFSTRDGALPSRMALYYNSLDPRKGSLGRGWSHNYDMSLKEKSDKSILISEGNWKYEYFTFSNGIYSAQPGFYSTLTKNPSGTFTLITKDGQVHTFNADGKLASISDRNGNVATFAYTGGNLSAVTDPSGREVVLSYDENNYLTTVADPAGSRYTFNYAGNSLTSVTYPDGGTWRYTYDSKLFMLSKIDPLGNTTSYSYDAGHRVASATDPEGQIRSISYPRPGTTAAHTTFTEKDGGIWIYDYDTKSGTLTAKTDPQGGITTYTYNAAGNRTSTILSGGSSTASTYDARGNTTSTTDALGQTTSYTYNAFDQLLAIQDPQGHTTGYAYDARGNLASMTDPTGAVTQYQYDSRGNVTRVANAIGQATTFAYDTAGHLTSVADPGGGTTSYSFDLVGNMTSQTDPAGAVTRFKYAARNRTVAVTDPAGNTTAYAYDRNGNRVSTTDANGRASTAEYNHQGQLIRTTDALANTTTYAYGGGGCPSCGGGTGKLTSVRDAKGNTTTYHYDTLGRLMSETDPLGNSTTYAYDTDGRVVARTDANDATTEFLYDSVGRLLKKTYPDGTSTTFAYDAKGNVLTASNADASYSFTYDAAGRPLSVTDDRGNAIKYSYDAAGRKVKTFYPEGSVVSYVYDAAGRLSSIMNGGGRTYFYTYDTTGRRSSLTFPNGAKATYSYYPAGRLSEFTHQASSGGTIAGFRYALDKVGNKLSKMTPDSTISYQYDPVYRLTQALSNSPGYSGNSTGKGGGIAKATQQQKEIYTYDTVGNRLTSDRTALYAYNEGNELVSDSETYAYDKNGNLIRKVASDGTTAYTWDYENRLIKVTRPDGTVIQFSYDPFGRRISKKVTQGAAVTTMTRYFYDDKNLILEYDGAGSVGNKYVHGPGIDEPLAVMTSKGTYFYHLDGLGSVVALTDQRGITVQTYGYDSYGNMNDQKSRVKQAFSFTGREWDKETELYYYRARYYDPKGGRFISKDPIAILGNISNNSYNVSEKQYLSSIVNPYSYTENNPINFTDPTGLASWHFDYTRLGERLIHYGKFRFNSTGQLVEHSGKLIRDIPCEAAKVLEWLRKVKPDFFRAGPVFLLLPGQEQMLDNFNKTGSVENDGSAVY